MNAKVILRSLGLMILFAFVAAFPSAGTDLGDGPFFRIDTQGRIHTDGGSFNSFSDYVRSDYFRDHRRRCLVKRAPLVADLYRNSRSSSDCSLFRTIIRDEYIPVRTILLPVVFHVIQNGEGTGALSDQRIVDQVAVLNEDFGALDGSLGEPGTNTRIGFVLAGITRSSNSSWFNDRDEMDYKQELAWDPERYVNIYTNSASGYLGYSYYAQEAAGEMYDGIVVLYEVVGGRNNGADIYDQGRTLVHEMGHYLGLLHTFEDGCTNSYQSGDLIVDTNPEAEEHYTCVQTDSCGVADPIHNYMNYTPDRCMDRFTREQANRMICTVINYRPLLYENLLPPKNAKLTRWENDLILFRETINHLSWEENGDSWTAVAAYRIYRKGSSESDDAYARIAELTADSLSYDDRFFSGSPEYDYRITALSESGLESGPASVEQGTDN